MDLAARRENIIQDHARLEKTRGSGWHPADGGALEREQAGEIDLSDRPIAFQADDRIHVVGRCADRVRTTMSVFLGRTPTSDDLLGSGMAYQNRVIANCIRACQQTGDLCLPTQDWNYCLEALRHEGLQIVLASA